MPCPIIQRCSDLDSKQKTGLIRVLRLPTALKTTKRADNQNGIQKYPYRRLVSLRTPLHFRRDRGKNRSTYLKFRSVWVSRYALRCSGLDAYPSGITALRVLRARKRRKKGGINLNCTVLSNWFFGFQINYPKYLAAFNIFRVLWKYFEPKRNCRKVWESIALCKLSINKTFVQYIVLFYISVCL